MTQLKCPECGKEITTQTDACPNCGCPVSLMEDLVSTKRSKIQSRMVALAKPIGILSLLVVVFFIFRRLLSSIEMGKVVVILNDICEYVGILAIYTLLLMWFMLLFKGSVKKSKMKTISIVAIIGICCFLLFCVIDDWMSLTIDFRGQYVGNVGFTLKGLPERVIAWTICTCGMYFFSDFSDVFYVSINLIQYALIGGSFCAMSKYFQGKMRVYSILTGIGFLLRWFLFVICVVVFFITRDAFALKEEIKIVIDLLCYISMALFFFEFSKTNKS